MTSLGFGYAHHVLQRSEANRGGWEEDKLLIIFQLFKVTATRRRRSDPNSYESNILEAERDMWASFSHFKHRLSSSSPNHEYEQRITGTLSSMGVPEDVHPAIIEKVFRVVEAAETTQLPVMVGVWDVHARYDGDDVGDNYSPNFTRASASSIEGLESLLEIQDDVIRRTPSCAICLEDFRAAGAGGVVLDEQQSIITRLPCGHHYHLHCIVQCLEINHLCPLCRYPMPTENHSN